MMGSFRLSSAWFTTLWVTILLSYATTSAYVSCQSNATHKTQWVIIGTLMGILPIWTMVARFSTNIAADGLLYDSIVAIVYYPALLYFSGTLGTLPWYKWFGFVVTLIGLAITRI